MIGFNFGRQSGRGMGNGFRKGMGTGRGMGRGNGQCRFEMSPGLGCIRNRSQGSGDLDPILAQRQISRLESFIENIQQKISVLKSRP